MSKVDIGASMVVWEDPNIEGIPRFTIWDKNRRLVYFPEERRGGVDIASWSEATVNQAYMDENASRIEYGQLPEKVRVAVQFKRNS